MGWNTIDADGEAYRIEQRVNASCIALPPARVPLARCASETTKRGAINHKANVDRGEEKRGKATAGSMLVLPDT